MSADYTWSGMPLCEHRIQFDCDQCKRPSSSDTVRVTLWFDTAIADVERYLGDDYDPETGEGITVESLAAELIRNHQARFGFIGWRVTQSNDHGNNNA